jgi:polyisoprenoid-binding protein YceI
MAGLKSILTALALVIGLPAMAEQVCYTADADSGELRFSGEAEGNRFRGHFREFAVRLCLDDDALETATIEVEVATGSATVGNRQGDQALLDEELFAAERYPRAFWTSTEINHEGQRHRAEGELSLRGISASQPVTLELQREADRLKLSGEAVIERLEFEVGQGEFADPDFISPDIALSFELNLRPES